MDRRRRVHRHSHFSQWISTFQLFFYGTVRVFDRSRNFQLIIILSFDCYWLILTDDNSSMPLMGRNKAQQRRSSSSLGDTYSLITLTRIMSFTFFTIWILTSLRGLLRAVWISYKLKWFSSSSFVSSYFFFVKNSLLLHMFYSLIYGRS